MQIIYSGGEFNHSKIDETFEQEFNCAKFNELRCLLLSSEHAPSGKYKFPQSIEPDISVIWRKWMLDSE